MAINFIKREEPQTRFLAVEKLNLLYNLFTTLLIIIFFNSLIIKIYKWHSAIIFTFVFKIIEILILCFYSCFFFVNPTF